VAINNHDGSVLFAGDLVALQSIAILNPMIKGLRRILQAKQLELEEQQLLTSLNLDKPSTWGKECEWWRHDGSPIGSVGILATPDQVIAITQESDNTRTLASVGRYEPVPPTLLGFDRETERITALAEKSDIQSQQLRATIVDSLDEEDWIGQTEFLKSCTGKTEDKLKALNQLMQEGVVERRGEGVSGSKKEIRLMVLFSVLPYGGEKGIETDRLNL
jgi:hypothetical protein